MKVDEDRAAAIEKEMEKQGYIHIDKASESLGYAYVSTLYYQMKKYGIRPVTRVGTRGRRAYITREELEMIRLGKIKRVWR